MNNRKSTNALITGLVAALLLVVFGFLVWQYVSGQQANTPTSPDVSSSTTQSNEEDPVNEGTISGSLTYPSEAIPENLVVHAYNIETQEDFFVKDHLTGDEYLYGVGYEMSVPAGTYYVYGVLAPDMEEKAYYNAFVVCGMSVECSDTAKIEVVVKAGKETENITVGDWYHI